MSLPKTVIYMADDDDDDRFMMRLSLQTLDPTVQIVEATDGNELMTLLASRSQQPAHQPVNLILLDMNMPKMNGLETLLAIRADASLRHIPTVMLSTSAEPEEVAVAYRNGVSGYIKKSTSTAYNTQIAQAISVCYLDATGN